MRRSPRVRKIDLVLLSGYNFGLTEAVICSQTRNVIFDSGLGFCQSEVGPALCLQYEIQSKGEVVIIAMEFVSSFDSEYPLLS